MGNFTEEYIPRKRLKMGDIATSWEKTGAWQSVFPLEHTPHLSPASGDRIPHIKPLGFA